MRLTFVSARLSKLSDVVTTKQCRTTLVNYWWYLMPHCESYNKHTITITVQHIHHQGISPFFKYMFNHAFKPNEATRLIFMHWIWVDNLRQNNKDWVVRYWKQQISTHIFMPHDCLWNCMTSKIQDFRTCLKQSYVRGVSVIIVAF